MKVALVIGHTNKKQGATSLFHLTEYEYGAEVAKHLGLDTFEFNDHLNYKRGCEELRSSVKGYDLVLHLHFNYSKNNTDNGCESIHWHKNELGFELAGMYIKTVSAFYNTVPLLPIPMIDKSQRGFEAFSIDGINLIVNPFYGSNKESYLFQYSDVYAEVLQEFINKARRLWERQHKI